MEAVVRIIGAGLAGSEAAWQCARRGVEVELFEMRPVRSTPAHQTADFAALGCSKKKCAAPDHCCSKSPALVPCPQGMHSRSTAPLSPPKSPKPSPASP